MCVHMYHDVCVCVRQKNSFFFPTVVVSAFFRMLFFFNVYVCVGENLINTECHFTFISDPDLTHPGMPGWVTIVDRDPPLPVLVPVEGVLSGSKLIDLIKVPTENHSTFCLLNKSLYCFASAILTVRGGRQLRINVNITSHALGYTQVRKDSMDTAGRRDKSSSVG